MFSFRFTNQQLILSVSRMCSPGVSYCIKFLFLKKMFDFEDIYFFLEIFPVKIFEKILKWLLQSLKSSSEMHWDRAWQYHTLEDFWKKTPFISNAVHCVRQLKKKQFILLASSAAWEIRVIWTANQGNTCKLVKLVK